MELRTICDISFFSHGIDVLILTVNYNTCHNIRGHWIKHEWGYFLSAVEIEHTRIVFMKFPKGNNCCLREKQLSFNSIYMSPLTLCLCLSMTVQCIVVLKVVNSRQVAT